MFGVIKFLDKEFSKTFELQILASINSDTFEEKTA